MLVVVIKRPNVLPRHRETVALGISALNVVINGRTAKHRGGVIGGSHE